MIKNKNESKPVVVECIILLIPYNFSHGSFDFGCKV